MSPTRLPPLAGRIAAAMQPPPPMLPPEAPLAHAVAAMAEARASALLAVDADRRPIGILTEQDVLRRVAFRAGPEAPLASAMTAPVIAIGEAEHLYRAIGLMRRHRLRHLVVLDEQGRPAGLLHRAETLAALAGGVLGHLDALAAQDSTGAMEQAKHAQAGLARALLDDGTPATEAVALVSAINLDLHRHVLEMALAAQPAPPPVPFTLLVMGSAGRGESLLQPDQDNGLVLGEYDDAGHAAIDTWFRAFAEDFNARLAAVGFSLCSGHVMARNPLWRKRLDEWEHQFALWAERRSPVALLFAAIAFDFAPAWGDPAPAARLRARLGAILRARPALLAALAAKERELTVGLTFWGGFTDDEEGPGRRTDLKLHGLMPLVAAVRLLALRAGLAETGTAARIAVLQARGDIVPADARALQDAFARLMQALLAQQLADLAAHRTPGSLVDTAAMPAAERGLLREGLKAVRGFARVVHAELTGGP